MAIYALDDIEPVLGIGCWIAPTAVVVGRVELGADVGVWFGAVLRGDNEPIRVGPRTNIQENTVIHTDPGYPVVVGEGCTVGHKAMIHGCTIGDYSLIGMGATVLNGASIGRNCLIGAGALVKEGEQVPDNSLVVGVPGRVIRRIDEEGEARLRRSSSHYVAQARRFAAGLRQIQG